MTMPQRPTRILVIDDEEQIRRALKSILRSRGYVLDWPPPEKRPSSQAIDNPPDLVVLDLGLPDRSGIEVCRELRTWMAAPILILSVHSSEADKITALDEGADDYLTKPFSAGELLARIRALLRRAAALTAPPPVVTAGDLVIDIARRRVTSGGARRWPSRPPSSTSSPSWRATPTRRHPEDDPRARVGSGVGRGRADPARTCEPPAQEDRAGAGRLPATSSPSPGVGFRLSVPEDRG